MLHLGQVVYFRLESGERREGVVTQIGIGMRTKPSSVMVTIQVQTDSGCYHVKRLASELEEQG